MTIDQALHFLNRAKRRIGGDKPLLATVEGTEDVSGWKVNEGQIEEDEDEENGIHASIGISEYERRG